MYLRRASSRVTSDEAIPWSRNVAERASDILSWPQITEMTLILAFGFRVCV